MRNLTLFNPARRLSLIAGMAVLMLLSAGCAVTPPAPTASLSAARQAITNAERSDALHYAGAELNDARRRLQMAENAVRNENMIEAERLADESKIAAELASAATETSKVLESNQELSRSVQALVDEMRRTGGPQ
ncbi:MAG: DUF4398 domain-containing protein [Wenzhouxiangellaceae bacterium]|nr:DUF4398 domain-containing protein [Wenzhouxiangellaceae bacterium]